MHWNLPRAATWCILMVLSADMLSNVRSCPPVICLEPSELGMNSNPVTKIPWAALIWYNLCKMTTKEGIHVCISIIYCTFPLVIRIYKKSVGSTYKVLNLQYLQLTNIEQIDFHLIRKLTSRKLWYMFCILTTRTFNSCWNSPQCWTLNSLIYSKRIDPCHCPVFLVSAVDLWR